MIKAIRHPGWTFAVDYGPLLIFFLVYKFAGVFAGTAAFMLAIAVAVLVSRAKLGRVSPMLWLSAILVVGFGGLTLWFHDPRFIQRKPTIIYVMLSALLFAGLAMRRPLLKYVLEAGFDGLSERGWMILSRNWALFFAALAVLNEVLVRTVSFDTWLTVKVWGVTALSFLFALAQAPVLMRHGLGEDAPPPL
ncbi:MAG: septation protein IspZ [Sphingomonadaceae bacterium]|nr:septation protein IspZ [Sphingomonadaceae bacterium]